MGLSAFGHGPAVRATGVQGHIQAAVMVGVGRGRCVSPGVIGREDTANKSDEGQAVAAVIAYCVNVPPKVAAGWNRLVKLRSATRASAAMRPDSAAIGMPGPGWMLPPAR